MSKISDALAKRLAATFMKSGGDIQSRDAMRDYADIATGSDLDCTQLDLLSDWMWRHTHVAPNVEPPAPGATAQDGVERAQWESCNCGEPPYDDEVVYDRNLTPRCPRCNVALGGDPMTATERAEAQDGVERHDVRCDCVGASGPNPDCGRCSGSGCCTLRIPQITTPTIPAGMVAWHGGDSAPEDWDGGNVQCRDGGMIRPGEGANALCWKHPHMIVGGKMQLGGDIIAYTPLAAAPTPPAPVGLEVERCEVILERLRAVHTRNPKEYAEVCSIIDAVRALASLNPATGAGETEGGK